MMADELLYVIDAPGLAKLVAQMAVLLRQDAGLRQIQAANELIATAFDQQSLAAGAVYSISQARQTAGVAFAFLVITFDATSGTGRYRIDGPPPTLTTGMGIPAGFSVLTIPGNANIQNFIMTPEAGQTLNFARYLML